eukprot:1709722-Rhodomonas_salina.1
MSCTPLCSFCAIAPAFCLAKASILNQLQTLIADEYHDGSAAGLAVLNNGEQSGSFFSFVQVRISASDCGSG